MSWDNASWNKLTVICVKCGQPMDWRTSFYVPGVGRVCSQCHEKNVRTEGKPVEFTYTWHHVPNSRSARSR